MLQRADADFRFTGRWEGDASAHSAGWGLSPFRVFMTVAEPSEIINPDGHTLEAALDQNRKNSQII